MCSNTIRRAWVGLLGHDSNILIGWWTNHRKYYWVMPYSGVANTEWRIYCRIARSISNKTLESNQLCQNTVAKTPIGNRHQHVWFDHSTRLMNIFLLFSYLHFSITCKLSSEHFSSVKLVPKVPPLLFKTTFPAWKMYHSDCKFILM